jgi:pentatricopeptide repeat protein
LWWFATSLPRCAELEIVLSVLNFFHEMSSGSNLAWLYKDAMDLILLTALGILGWCCTSYAFAPAPPASKKMIEEVPSDEGNTAEDEENDVAVGNKVENKLRRPSCHEVSSCPSCSAILDASSDEIEQLAARVEEALSKAETPDSTSNMYSAVVTAYNKHGEPIKAAHWLSRMLAAGCRPSPGCFGGIINAYAKMGDLPNAEKWHYRMTSCNISGNVISYTAVVEACAKT